MPILPAERDPRLITVRRGGTLTDEHHRLLAEWAGLCAEHVLHLFDEEQPRDTRPRDAIDVGRAWVRGEVRMGDARRAAFAANAAARGLPDPAKFAALAAGQAAAAVAHVAAHDLGAAAYAIRPSAPLRPPVRLRRHASGNESGSEKDSPRRFKNWSSMTSEVEARSAGTYSTTDIGPFVASHSDRDRSQRRARKPIPCRTTLRGAA
jgi:hypothetical protein